MRLVIWRAHYDVIVMFNGFHNMCETVNYAKVEYILEYLRYLHQFHFMERCLSGSDWSRQFLRQFQLWYAKPGLSCRPTCRIGCRISNTKVFKLPDFVHWGAYYWRQPGRQAGGQQSLRQLLSSGLELCPLALLQLLSYRAQLWVLGTPYGFNTDWEQAMDSSFAYYQGKLTTRPFSCSVNWCTGF